MSLVEQGDANNLATVAALRRVHDGRPVSHQSRNRHLSSQTEWRFLSSPLARADAAKTLHSSPEGLYQAFDKYFSLIDADTPERISQAQQIRYQVYCIENAFENPKEHSDGREKDAFDSHSIHTLLIHRPSDTAMGTVRLVLPLERFPEKSFAIQSVVDSSFLNTEIYFPIATTAEVSRFSISKTFRQSREDGTYPDEITNPTLSSPNGRRRHGPLMSLGLIQGLIRMSAVQKITHWCAIMEPKLLRMLTQFGIYFEPIGGLVEYHGQRQPCFCSVDAMLERVRNEHPDYWEILTDRGTIW